MSGSRTANQELVYCHACMNEFYKERDNLQCPECHSDFTEVVDPTFDPREDSEPQRPPQQHSGWGQDPDEADIDHLPHGRHEFMRNDPFMSTFHTPLFQNFSSMVSEMTGAPPTQGFPPQFHSGPPGFQPRPPGLFSHPPSGSPLFPPQFESRQRPRSEDWPRQGEAQFQARSFPGGSGGIHISFTTSNGIRESSTQRAEFNDANDFFRAMMQAPRVSRDSDRAGQHGQPPNPFGTSPLAAIFRSLMNPANAQSGDAVFTQEAFDRIMSQLMEQHRSGTAPGPASEAAIAALPRKKVSEDMLDEETHQAECTICMENVTVGEEVTVLPCHHWFHHPCVEAWLKEHDTCPICRSGIVPKEGDPNTPRTPQQAPLHDNDPFLLARQQSGTRENPFVVPESPAQERRRPTTRRYSSEQGSSRRRSENEGSSGFTGRVRSFFGGGNGGGWGPNNQSSGEGGDGASRR